MTRSIVHLVRHGEVENPAKVLYGRLPDYHLSATGERMAERVAEWAESRPITYVGASPLERAQETVQPIAKALSLEINTDVRLIEAANRFEGKPFGVGDGALRKPSAWWHLRNPLRPSWGEPYKQVVVRMLAAIAEARRAVPGSEALLVSHQLPIWIVRSYVEGRRLWHDPRRRECGLASVTSVEYDGDRMVGVTYAEPAGDLLAARASDEFDAGA